MKTLSTILYTLVIVLLLGVAGLFVVSLVPIPGNIEIKIVKSGSMEPTIETGSIVIIKPATDYQVGDIVTFGADTRNDIPTTHRIVAIDNSLTTGARIVTKGDANEEADPGYTDIKSVIGRVMVSVPYVGYVLDFARRPVGFALMIGVPAAVIIADETFKIVREVMTMRRRKKYEV